MASSTVREDVSGSQTTKYAIVRHNPFAVTDEGFCAVDGLWGWELDAYLTSGFFGEILVLATRDRRYEKDHYCFVFGNERKGISFKEICPWGGPLASRHGLSQVENIAEYLLHTPGITYRLWKEIAHARIIESGGTAYPPIGMLTNILGYARRKKRVFVLDYDVISLLELWQKTSSSALKSMLLTCLKISYSALVGFCIRTSQLTLVFGNSLFTRYGNLGNVVKIHASWVNDRDIIPAAQLDEKLASLEGRSLRIMFASSLTPDKGAGYAVQGAELLIREMEIPVTFDIYGEGSMRRSLEAVVSSHGLSQHVTFAGVLPYGDRFYDALRRHDCILIANPTGELPRVLFDALANGVAVLASNTDAINDIISNGSNGLLFTPGDSRGIATAVAGLHGNRKLLANIIRNGADTARMFTLQSRIKQTAEAIEVAFGEDKGTRSQAGAE